MYPRPETPTSRLHEARRKLFRSSGVFRAIGPITQSPKVHYSREVFPLNTTENQAKLQAISDAFSALHKNIDELASTHKAITGFNESFASFLYGLMINTFCVNFKEGPTKEKYDAFTEEQNDEEQIAELQAKLHAARRRNALLKEQISQKETETGPKLHFENLFSQRPLSKERVPPQRPFAPLSRQRKIAVARDESYSTTDTFIEAPGSAQPASTVSRTGASQTNTAPNLDQAPRYMRGLFEIPGASNKRHNFAHRVEKKPSARLAMRAPQKTSFRKPDSATNAQRIPGYGSSVSERSAISAAAQRAQKARANRMSSRPPFR